MLELDDHQNHLKLTLNDRNSTVFNQIYVKNISNQSFYLALSFKIHED